MKSWFRKLAPYLQQRIPLPVWGLPTTTAQQQQSLLRLIAVAIEEHLPLAPLLRAWSEGEQGVRRVRLQRLVRLLESGKPLPDAVEQVPGVLPDQGILAIRFDSQTGTRTTAVRQWL